MFRMNSAYSLEQTRRNLAAARSEDVPCLNQLLESVSTDDAYSDGFKDEKAKPGMLHRVKPIKPLQRS